MKKGLDALIRIHQFELDEKRRALKELETVRANIETAIRMLENEVDREQKAAVGSVEAGMAYGNYARAAIARRGRLEQNLRDIEPQVEAAREVVAQAFEELKKYEITKAGRDKAAVAEANRKEQILMDELGLSAYMRK